LLEVIEVRKLILFLVSAIALFIIGLNSFAANENQINLNKHENNISDNAKFITFKDEEGNVKLFKTLALLKFDGGKIKIERAKFIPIHKKEADIQDYRTYFK
jgi:hypothetical protein